MHTQIPELQELEQVKSQRNQNQFYRFFCILKMSPNHILYLKLLHVPHGIRNKVQRIWLKYIYEMLYNFHLLKSLFLQIIFI